MAKKLKKGKFDLEDLRGQLQQMKKMGGMGALMGLMPGMGQMKKAMSEANVSEKVFDRQVAIIDSMTKKERAQPELLNASRRKRIAKGAGVEVSDINKLIKQHRQMADMMKKMSRGKGRHGGGDGRHDRRSHARRHGHAGRDARYGQHGSGPARTHGA